MRHHRHAMSAYQSYDLCPECPTPPGVPLYEPRAQQHARSCLLCGYSRPPPAADAAKLLVVGSGSDADGMQWVRTQGVVAGIRVGQLSGLRMGGPTLRGRPRFRPADRCCRAARQRHHYRRASEIQVHF